MLQSALHALLNKPGSFGMAGEDTFCVACSLLTDGNTMTLLPWVQLTGVATEYFAVSCSESITRKICAGQNIVSCLHNRTSLPY